MLQMLKKYATKLSMVLSAFSKIKKMLPRSWSPVRMHSLNEPPKKEGEAEEEEEEKIQWAEEESSQAGIPEIRYTVAVLAKQGPALL